MFRQDLKINLKNKIMCDNKFINDIFDFIKIAIDLNNKLYKKIIKKQ
jgi:hypothetical protein